jgi:Cellulase (glycosyl hydrolase family 5).
MYINSKYTLMKQIISILFFSNLFFTCCAGNNNGTDRSSDLNSGDNSNDHVTDVRISIQGNQFFVGSERIWLNGVNTPWDNWNDFGGGFNHQWWNDHFRELKNHGINSSRIWISCSSSGAVYSNETGVTGLSDTFFTHCDSLFAIAKRNGIYIKATMMSFDHCKNANAGHQNWRNIINVPEASQTFIDVYLLPFINRYKNNPYLFAIDLCNEPEWISENEECGQLPVANLQRFFAMCAAAIHENSDVPVTIGSACIKWNSDNNGCAGNYWKDSNLQAAFDNSKAFLDFYSIHYYAWVYPYYKSPFDMSPKEYGIDDKPVLIGEVAASDAGIKETSMTLLEAYENAFKIGYQGVMPWTSNGVDKLGNLTTMGQTALEFKNRHYKLVCPVN